MNCACCGAEVAPEAAFCSTCGTAWPTAPADPSTYLPPPPQDAPYPYQPSAPPLKVTNGLSIASLVLGILWIAGLGSILALIFGYVGLRQIRRRHEGGRGLAIAGVVLGWVGVGLTLLFIALAVIATGSDTSRNSARPAGTPTTHYAAQFANIMQPLDNESEPQNAATVTPSQLTATLQTIVSELQRDHWPGSAQADINHLVANFQDVLAGDLSSTSGTTSATDEEKVATDLSGS
jgi:Domain of unknown function (DUF4190)